MDLWKGMIANDGGPIMMAETNGVGRGGELDTSSESP